MTLTLESFNALPRESAKMELERCCGSQKWVESMLEGRPFLSRGALQDSADRIWLRLSPSDWLEAFSHHPKIGEKTSGREAEEQKGTAGASRLVLNRLAEGNLAYEKRFGHIFLICATGRSAEEMLVLLEARLNNPPDIELKIAAAEQSKITRIRLEKLFA